MARERRDEAREVQRLVTVAGEMARERRDEARERGKPATKMEGQIKRQNGAYRSSCVCVRVCVCGGGGVILM